MSTESLQLKFGVDGLEQVQAGLKHLSHSIGEIGESAMEILPALAAIGSVAAFGELIKSSMEFSHQIELAGKKSGIVAEQMLSLNYAAEMSHVGLDELQTSLKFYSKYLENSGRGNENLFDSLMEQAALFQKLPEGPQRATLALERFGRAGLVMIPFLEKGPVAIKALLEESDRYAKINGAAAITTERFDQASVRLHSSLRGLGTEIGVQLYPSITNITNGMAAAAASVRDFVANSPELISTTKAVAIAATTISALSAAPHAFSFLGGIGASVGGVKSLGDFVAYLKLLPTIAGAAAASVAVVAAEIVALAASIYTVTKLVQMLDAQTQALQSVSERAQTVGKLSDMVFAKIRELRSSGKMSATESEGIMAPLREAGRSGDIDKLQAALTKAAVALRAIQGTDASKGSIIWTKEELDRQEKALSLEEKQIRIGVERDKMQRMPNAQADSVASTSDWQVKLSGQIRQRQTMLNEAKAQGALSETEYQERAIKLDEDRLKLQKEINADNRDGQAKTNELFEDAFQKKMEQLALDKELVALDFRLPGDEKQAAEKAILKLELEKIDELKAQYEWELRIAQLNKDALAYEQAQKRLKELDKEKSGTQGKIAANDAKPNDDSWGDQFGAVWAKMKDIPSLAKDAANTLETTWFAALSSIKSGISDVILGTKSWGQALQSIESTVITSLVQGIVQMGVDFVEQHVLMTGVMYAFHAVRSALGWIAHAETITQETEKAPLLAANATTASVGSYGLAAILGIAALVAALGVGIAAATGAFAEGGYTGAGGKYDVAGVVHRGEFVMPANAVNRIGLPALEAAKSGSGGGFGGGGSSQTIHVNYFDDGSKLRNHIRNNPDVQHALVDFVGRNTHKFTRRT